MKKYEVMTQQDLEFVTDVEIRLENDEFDAELESSNARVYVSNDRILADFVAKIKVFNSSFGDEYAIVEIDATTLDLTHTPAFFSFGVYFDIGELQCRDTDRIEKLKEIVYEQLLVEAKFYAK